MEEGAMPRLCRLSIYTCTKLKKLPDSLPSLTALRQLEIVCMPTEFTEKIKTGGEDYYKVQHIPFLSVGATLPDEEHAWQ
ncbi:Disease resistance protein [Quillaja saponaria]|uniref:Disease resistance protein n=1 Tax=Quillaja saponaria TaxID=32244 RepID=A0AAD7VFI0_QUISA|nr:Disease resistance protein [Quillaja saponaria]